VNISGSSGNLAHSYQVSVIVAQAQRPSDSSFLGLSTGTFYMLAGAIAAVFAAVVGTLVIPRRRRNSRV
jgi:branched-subunit amino acid ABC-type transport system permease component